MPTTTTHMTDIDYCLICGKHIGFGSDPAVCSDEKCQNNFWIECVFNKWVEDLKDTEQWQYTMSRNNTHMSYSQRKPPGFTKSSQTQNGCATYHANSAGNSGNRRNRIWGCRMAAWFPFMNIDTINQRAFTRTVSFGLVRWCKSQIPGRREG